MVLLREIKRRRVLHTLSLYIVGCWVALQVVEVLSEAGLPPETMRYLLVAMSAGFPLVLLVAWFFDVSVDGITRTRPRADDAELPDLNLGDHALLAGILVVLALNAYVLWSPAPEDAPAQTASGGPTLVILAFAGEGGEDVGAAFAEELRSELRRFAGVRVLGPETSLAIEAAGERRDLIAKELGVTSLLVGEATMADGRIRVSAAVHRLPAGNTVWKSDYEASVSDGPALLEQIATAVLDALIPTAVADTPQGPRVDADACARGYEDYLRGRQLLALGAGRARASEPLLRATQLDPSCGLAWAALAWAYVDWTLEGFAKAAAAARRALEINDALAEAWAVLAEIAEEEARWSESERLFLKALYLDPSNAYVNTMYAEALVTRGRAREAVHYALEGYRHEPASRHANFRVQLAALYSGNAELVLKHGKIGIELAVSDTSMAGAWEMIAEGHLLQGDSATAAGIIEQHVGFSAEWYAQCVRSIADPTLRDGLLSSMSATLRQIRAGELSSKQAYFQEWQVIRCAIFLEEPGFVVDVMTAKDFPTELDFTLFFLPDAAFLRQTEHFRKLVIERGLLDYWKEWGWADFCRPDGESFTCD
jgi:TolB-like protein